MRPPNMFKRRQLTPRPGRLASTLAALALALIIAAPLPAAGDPALARPVCRLQTASNGRAVCWCRGAYGWRAAPRFACTVWRDR